MKGRARSIGPVGALADSLEVEHPGAASAGTALGIRSAPPNSWRQLLYERAIIGDEDRQCDMEQEFHGALPGQDQSPIALGNRAYL